MFKQCYTQLANGATLLSAITLLLYLFVDFVTHLQCIHSHLH